MIRSRITPAGRVRHSCATRTSRSSPNAVYPASKASVTPSVYMMTRSPVFSCTYLRGTVHIRENTHRDPVLLQKYRLAAVPPHDKGRVVAGICTGKRQLPGVKDGRKHGDKHAGRSTPGNQVVCRTERTGGIRRALKTRPYQRPRHCHEERRTYPLTGYIGDHKGPPAVTDRDNIIKVPADLHCRDHHCRYIKTGDLPASFRAGNWSGCSARSPFPLRTALFLRSSF